MASLEEIRAARLEKIKILETAGMNPYASEVPRTITLRDLKQNYERLATEEKQHSITGRIMAIRGQGAIQFILLKEGNEEFQAVIKKDEISEKIFSLFQETVDIGDFISVTGSLFSTKRGENSLLVTDWIMASKSLRPLPEKWHGLTDQDTRYRQRYLETTTDTSVFERFVLRSKIIRAIRSYMEDLQFIEIETPILQNQTGGAMAEVFHTHHNALDQDMVLRIALEIDHKLVVAGGYERIFEIGKIFRNEGMDPTHLQEFTMIEWYAAWATLEDNLRWTEDMIKHIAHEIIGKDIYTVWDKNGKEHQIDLTKPWEKVAFSDLLIQNANLHMNTASDEDVRSKAKEWGLDEQESKTMGRANLLDFIYKKSSRANIIAPTFVTGYPSSLKPLARPNTDGTADVAQLVIAGAEITNQYGELVNPLAQRRLLEEQANAKAAGDKEAMDVDERFLVAMEHGMPPMTGFGMGIDRLTAILTEQKNLRDTIFFPIVKPID